MPADLTDDTYPDGTDAQKLRYWELKRISIGGVQSVSTRDKTVVYDPKYIEKMIERFELLVRRSGRPSRIILTTHSRH